MDGVRNNGGSFYHRFNKGSVEDCVGGGEEGGGGHSGVGSCEGSSVEKELGISLSFSLVQAVDGLVAVAGEGTGVTGGGVRPVVVEGVGSVQGVQRIGFRLCGAKRGEGENSGLQK